MTIENHLGPIVLACDEAYAMPLATTIRSIIDAHPSRWPVILYVLSGGISRATRARILDSLPPGSADLNWIPIEQSSFSGFGTLQHVSPMTFARFRIPEVLPATVSRILYLDADVLVLNDLSPLWRADLHGCAVGAVLDALDVYLQGNGQIPAHLPCLDQIPRVQDYFNAGVLLIDVERWRDQQISKRALDYLREHPMSPFSDQDALNVACDGAWWRLDECWNFQDHYRTRVSRLPAHAQPVIIHFVTRLKPWCPESMSVNAGLYDHFRRRTLFARSLEERMHDSIVGVWFRFKRMLWRHSVFRALRARLHAKTNMAVPAR